MSPLKSTSATSSAISAARFIDYCHTITQIATTRSTSAKIALFATYLKTLPSEDDLHLAVQFTGEGAFETTSGKRAAIGHRTIALCAAEFCEIDYEHVFRPSRIATGSSSETIEKLMANLDAARSKRVEKGLPLQEIARIFTQIASLRTRSDKEMALRQAWAQMSPPEIKYFLRILGGGSLRIGFETRSILVAIAEAFEADPEAVRYTHMLSGSLGKTIRMARQSALGQAQFQLFHPFAFMLASPGDTPILQDLNAYLAEEKFDGMRCQVHIDGARVQLYSRDLNDISESFPDLVEYFGQKTMSPTVLDGEICAFKDNTIQSFQMLQKRMGVKKPSTRLVQECAVIFVAYDVVFHNHVPLFDQPLQKRRTSLEVICAQHDIRLVEQYPLSDSSDIERLFEQALAHGNEGLMLKNRESTYEYGQRRKSWMKLKKPGGTLDTVILYATAGSGKRGGTYSDFTLGVRTGAQNEYGDEFVPIGKAYGGYTDAALRRLNEAIKPLIRDKFGPTLALEPRLVVEIEFDEIQVNKRTKAGFTLRFPRFRAIRWDLGPDHTDTVDEVRRLYDEKQARKRLPQQENPSFR
jgi:DNA ligase 1